MNKTRILTTLMATTIFCGAAVTAAPAFAQASDQAAPQATSSSGQNVNDTPPQAKANAPEENGGEIVVTGTLFRNQAATTASPITVLSSADLANRGINTVADAIQALAANNAGTLNTNWSQFGFPKGASAPSLRGLDDGRTLTVFDGLRSAPYPLADDGYRNFVDINTIPESIVDRIEVLQDGASATYGADAIAGVVNVIVKKQITGLHLNGSAAISGKSDYGEQRVDATYGYGDLDRQGFNIYINGEYQNNDPLYLRDRGFPYGTADRSSICAPSNGQGLVAAGALTCMANGIANGVQANGAYALGTTIVPIVRPFNAAGTAAIPGSTYQLLNPAAGCQGLPVYALTAAQQAANPSAPATVCQQDKVAQYYQYSGGIERIGANAHATVNLGSHAQFYAMFNFYQTKTWNPLTPEGYANQTAAGGTQVTLSPIILPVYVCARGTAAACTAANGTLNPQNPFASLGESARLVADYDLPTEDDTQARTFRYTAGISGSFGGANDWNYNVEATHSDVHLKYTFKNYILAQHLLDVIADGSFNFANPSANSQAERDYLAPPVTITPVSLLTQVQATLTHAFFNLPGGALNVAIGASYRYEAIHDPSANPANEADPTDRYYGINAVGVDGSRNVKSAYFEIDAPIFSQLDLKAEGRYDKYSSGQDNFSPKFEAEFRPIRQIKLRGTYTKGFAIASFNEAYGLPTTGYINTQIDATSAAGKAFQALHGNDPYSTQTYSYGLTSIGNPAVKPEKSTQYTLGAVFEPVRWLSLTADYYNIKIKDLITTPDCSGVVQQYYANNGVTNVPGCTTTEGVPDANFPNALPLLGTISSYYTNADALMTHGMDFTAVGRFPLGHGIRLTSNFNATWIMYYGEKLNDGRVDRFDGTLSPCNITSCSGTPKWRANWENTIDFNGKGTLSATINYTSGYDLESTDSIAGYTGVPGDCLGSIGTSVVTYQDQSTPVSCHTKRFIDVDMSASIKVGSRFTLYTNVLNVFNVKPPFDPSAGYSLYEFNPAWAGSGFIGRYIRFGAKVDF